MGTPPRRAALAAATAATAAALAAPAAALAAADVTVNPSAVAPGGTFTLAAYCGAGATSASVSGTAIGGPSEITLNPYTGGGPGAFNATLTVPATTLPGTYQLNVTCADGETGTGTLVVSPTGAPAGGGGSTSETPHRVLLGAGSGLLAASGLGAFLMLRRRYRGTHAA
jgi:5'-nucleotidase